MNNKRDNDIYKIKTSILTQEDLGWLKNQIITLEKMIREKNKSHQDKAKRLLATIENLYHSKFPLEYRFYACLSQLQHYWQTLTGKNQQLWSLFYNTPGDRLIEIMEKDKTHHTFARGLATLLQRVSDAIPSLFITTISETSKKELTATLKEVDNPMISFLEIETAKQSLLLP